MLRFVAIALIVTTAAPSSAQSDLASQALDYAKEEGKFTPSVAVAGTMALGALMGSLRRRDMDPGMLSPVTRAGEVIGVYGTPVLYVASALAGLGMKDQPVTGPSSVQLNTAMYLIDFKKESALTGSLAREPSGLGVGYEWDLRYEHPEWGATAGAKVTWQQTNIDENDYVWVTGFFGKLDLPFGLDIARALATLTESRWLARQQLAFTAGPSFFRSTVVMADCCSGFGHPRDGVLNQSAPIVRATGYELAGHGRIKVANVFGAAASYQRGTYTKLDFPRIDGDQAALVALIGYDELRGGSSYTWERIHVAIDVPFIGMNERGSFKLGGENATYRSSKGSAVNNRGLSLAGEWKW